MALMLDKVRATAADLKFGRALATLALLPFYAAGWAAGAAWQVGAHVVAAVKVGWSEAASR